ncbi:MAG: hypothetical protein CMA16_02735 [Euryarchaeota archaeon]|nr:hypothetical protein [Euryarchaeota archaeon]|tara:strand:+ start:8910 stop:11522 length:2613 start_codon:yes stop_codon:yes gene_type:complete
MNMFNLFKNKPQEREIKIIDLTLNSRLEDDYILPQELEHELLIRRLKTSLTPSAAQQKIAEWEDEFSIKSIREEYKNKNWEEVIRLTNSRIEVHGGEEAFIQNIRSLYQLKLWQECIISCNNLLQIDGENQTAIRFIARCRKNLGEDTEAELYFLKLLEFNQKDIDSLITLARINYNNKDYKKSIQHSENILAIEPHSVTCRRLISRSYLAMNEFKLSIPHLEWLIDHSENDLEALVDLGRTYYSMKQYSTSRTYLEKAHSMNPHDRRARRTLALIYERQGEWQQASTIYELECLEEPESFSNWEKHISLLYKLNKIDDAKKSILQIINTDSTSMKLYVISHSICRSFFWNDIAERLQIEMEQKWPREAALYILMAQFSLSNGYLTDCYSYLLKCRRKDRRLKSYTNLLLQLQKTLDQVDYSLKELKKAVKRKRQVLISECAIKKIFSLAQKVPKYQPRKSKKKLVMVSSTLGRGGAERQVLTCLKELDKSNNFSELTLLCRYKGSNKPESSYLSEISKLNVNVFENINEEEWVKSFGKLDNDTIFGEAFLLLPKTMQHSIRSYFSAIRKIKPDIVHAWQDQTNIEIAIAARMAGVPGIVLFARSLRPDGKTMAHIRNRMYLKNSYKYILQEPNIVLSHNSNAGKLSYANWLEVPEQTFSTIHNGIDFEEFVDSSQDLDVEDKLFEFGIDKNSTIVGGVFRLVREKRPSLWIASMYKVLQNDSKLHGIIVGGGALEPEMRSLIRELGMEKRIHLVGETRFVKAWLDTFDLFLLTSSIEGLPNVLIEAQAFGVPVVTTDAGGASDTIVPGETGYVVEDNSKSIADRIRSCLSDEKWLENASNLSVTHAQNKFSPENMSKKLLEIYDKSLEV